MLGMEMGIRESGNRDGSKRRRRRRRRRETRLASHHHHHHPLSLLTTTTTTTTLSPRLSSPGPSTMRLRYALPLLSLPLLAYTSPAPAPAPAHHSSSSSASSGSVNGGGSGDPGVYPGGSDAANTGWRSLPPVTGAKIDNTTVKVASGATLVSVPSPRVSGVADLGDLGDPGDVPACAGWPFLAEPRTERCLLFSPSDHLPHRQL